MPILTRTFRVFVSSTFEDLKEERNALQRKAEPGAPHHEVFPSLRKLCEEHGARFQAIDLRWGVRDEAALDQKTMEICLREIERCQRTGIKPNFIVLLGQRYGWRPLPARIEVSEFEDVRDRIADPEDHGLVESWYQRDDNAVPPEYLLKPRTGEWVDRTRWEEIEARLHRILLDAARAAGLSDQALVKYWASATHQEILKGLSATPEDRRHVFAFCRDVPGNEGDPALVRLKEFLRAQLPAGNLRSYAPDDLEGLCQDVEQTLRAVIESEAAGFESRPAQALETKAHDDFARERALVFGREEVLKEITEYVCAGGDRPLVLYGVSGSGKSAVMAQASERAGATLPSAVVIRRFIGASPDSSSGLTLLPSLSAQIGEAYGAAGEQPADFNGMTRVFRERLGLATSERPLVVFVDALDQLGKDDPARSFAWLSGTLPPHCRIVVSTIELVPVLNECKPLPLADLPQEAAAAALDYWLEASRRRLQPAQRERLLAAFSRCRQALYLKLAFEEARGWASHLPPEQCLLGESVEGVIDTLFKRLSLQANHGPVLVSHSLGYLAAARYGLTEDEILDVLSADRHVWKDFISHKHYDPPQQRLPVVVWSRLLLDLEPYLTERIADEVLVTAFYHLQMQQAATERYLDGPMKRHQHLHLAHLLEQACEGPEGSYLPVKRSIAEVAYHYRMCKHRRKLKALYASLSYLCSYVKCRNAFELKDEMQAVPAPYIDGEVRLFVSNTAWLLVTNPKQAPQLMYKELASPSYRQQAERLAARPWIRVDPVRMNTEVADQAIAVSPVISVEMRVGASCVAANAHLAFLHNAANRIALLRTEDLRPCGEISLPQNFPFAIKRLLCDRWGSLLALVYDNAEIEVLRTYFSPSGDIVFTNSVHRGLCLVGRFGAISACSCLDDIIYQSPDHRIIGLHIDGAGQVSSTDMPSDGRTLMSYFGSDDLRCLAWRDGSGHFLAFPESTARVDLAYRALAVCRLGTRLAVSTEESRLLIYRWPSLELEKVLPCRLPILSISPTHRDVLLMTDRHGNILSLDSDLQIVEHGRCSQDLYDDYPSAVYPTGCGALYISQRRCVTLSLGGVARHDIMRIDAQDDRYSLLTYSRVRGYMLSIGGGAPRPLQQAIVGHQYEFEFSKFRAAWSERGTVAYTKTPRSVAVEDGERSTCHSTDSDIEEISYCRTLNAFLVLCRSGLLHCLTTEDVKPFSVQFPRSDTGQYLMEICGAYVCVITQNVLCQMGYSNTYIETNVSLYRLFRSRGSAKAELIDFQHIDSTQPSIVSLSYHGASNSLYLWREGTLERWQLDEPKRHNLTRVAVARDRDASLPFCAQGDGCFYIDTNNRLRFQPMASARGTAELASFRTITFLSSAMEKCGYMVEDNQHLYRFAIEEE
ncbi:MAG TPA: DUF4062 domain-containing protein [Terriglobales bacterium]|jgi:hypothetical protein